MRYLIVSLAMLFAATAQAVDVHRIVLHVDEADPARQELVLNNASNINKHYQDKGEEVQIEIVAYGPGLKMLLPQSEAAGRIKSIAQNYENVSFRACSNTLKKMEQKAGKSIALVPEAKMVPSGVVHLVERQEAGWSYIRP